MFGIRLELDKGSVKTASRDIQKEAEKVVARQQRSAEVKKEVNRIRREKGLDAEKTGGGTAKAAAAGGAVGGIIGSLIGQLKPIQELLGIISGIMQIFVMPVMLLLKPFIILFLRLGQILYKWLQSSGVAGALGAASAGAQEGGLSGISEGLGKYIEDYMKKTGESTIMGIFLTLGAILLGAAAILALVIFGIPGLILVAVVALITGLYLAWDYIKAGFIWVGDKIKGAWSWVGSAASAVWEWLKKGFENVINFGKDIWELFLSGLEFIGDLGSMLWDWFKEALSGISDLGSKIWNYIKSSLGSLFGGGGGSTSVNDALVTSGGKVVHLNTNDNVLAFQDYSQLASYTAGGNSGKTMVVNNYVEGFVGDEERLAEYLNKLIAGQNRAGSASYT